MTEAEMIVQEQTSRMQSARTLLHQWDTELAKEGVSRGLERGRIKKLLEILDDSVPIDERAIEAYEMNCGGGDGQKTD